MYNCPHWAYYTFAISEPIVDYANCGLNAIL